MDPSRATIKRRYDRVAPFLSLFDWLFFVPPNLRSKAVAKLDLHPGSRVLDIGCGTGKSLPHLRAAVGNTGYIYGVDISPVMLQKTEQLREHHHWHNLELIEGDATDVMVPAPLDGALFSFSYNTIPNHSGVLRHVWQMLRPGGRVVIVDAKLPPWGRTLLLPFSLWLMKNTLLGNPLIRPWEELRSITDAFHMEEFQFGSYYICCGIKLEPHKRSDR